MTAIDQSASWSPWNLDHRYLGRTLPTGQILQGNAIGKAAPVTIAGALAASSLAQGVIATPVTTADQSGITTAVDITSLTATFAVATHRRIKYSWVLSVANTVTSDLIGIQVTDGAGAPISTQFDYPAVLTGVTFTATGHWVETPAAGTITRKLQIAASGSGSSLGATRPGMFTIEDVGLAP